MRLDMFPRELDAALKTLFDLIETNCYDFREALHLAAFAHSVNYEDLWDAYDKRP